jgi:hypothetical protein
MLLKIMTVLLIIFVALMIINGIATYWPFVVGTLIGLLFSPLFKYVVEDFFGGELPEFWQFTLTEVGEALFMDDERMKQYREDMREKENGAIQEVNSMRQKVADIDKTYNQLKNRLTTELYQEAKGQRYSSRVRRGIRAQMGDDKLASHLKKKDQSVDWDKYL